jgi:hypothetical protein
MTYKSVTFQEKNYDKVHDQINTRRSRRTDGDY